MKAIISSIFVAAVATAVAAASPSTEPTRMAGGGIRLDSLNISRGGGFVVLNMTLNLDSLDLPANTRLVYTPMLASSAGRQPMPQIVINGRRQHIMFERGDRSGLAEGATVVRRANGRAQSLPYRAAMPLGEELAEYDITIHEDLCGCGDSLDGNNYLLRRRRKPLMAFVRPQAEALKERHIDKTAYIDFPVDRTELHPGYRRNPAELDSIINTINMVKADTNLSIRHIEIHGFASPESPYSHNDYLARERARTLKDYVRRLVSLDDSLFSVAHTPENWQGLAAFIKGSNLDSRNAILAIIDDPNLDPDTRERKIKTNHPDDYRFMLATWYPALRRSDYHISYTVRPFSVEEARRLVFTKPQQLSLEEMFLVAQACEPGSAEFNEVMEIAVRMFPHDATANLNAACTRLNAGDAKGAKPYLDKAGDSPQALNARAAYHQLTGNDEEAAALYRRAADAGLEQARTNLGNIK